MRNTLGLSLGAALLCAAPASYAESLLEVYQQALQSDPLVREAEANRMAAEEAIPQARGNLFPQINGTATFSESNSDGNNIFTQGIFDANGDPVTDGQGNPVVRVINAQSEQESTNTQWQIELSQTLFRWDQFVGLKQAGKRVAQANANYEATQQELIVRVATRYFDVLAGQDTLAASQASRRAIARQLDQAKQRFDVGLIAITDVQESQAAYDQAVADEIFAKRNLATAKEFLREITGAYSGDLDAPKKGLPLLMPAPANPDDWVTTAIDQNLALQSSRINAELAKTEISARRGGHYPTLSLFARVNDDEFDAVRSDNNSPFQPADSLRNSDSIGVQLSVPIFSGGVTSSRVREAVYSHRAAREQLQRVARETERQARDAYLGIESDIARVNALTQSLASNTTALEATEAGLEVGTRTTVDVLDAQRNLFNAYTSLERARYDYLLNVLRLKQASGILRVQDLESIEEWLVPRTTDTVPQGIRPIAGDQAGG